MAKNENLETPAFLMQAIFSVIDAIIAAKKLRHAVALEKMEKEESGQKTP